MNKRRRIRKIERRQDESLEEILERVQRGDYVIKTGAGSLVADGALKDIDPEVLRQIFLDRFGIDINAEPDWKV